MAKKITSTATAAAGAKIVSDKERKAELLASGFNGREIPEGYLWSDRHGWVEDGPPKAPRN